MDREDALLRTFRECGDARAMEALVAATRPRLLGVARRIGAPQDAEDSVQAAYHALLRRPTWDEGATVTGWLVTAVVRIAYRRKAAVRRDAVLAERLARPRDAADAARDAERDELRRLVRREVHRLPERYRDAVVLHHLEGVPVADVARLLDVPEATVRTWTRRGRLLLQARLRPAFAQAALAVPWALSDWAALAGGTAMKGKLAVAAGVLLVGAGTCALLELSRTTHPGGVPDAAGSTSAPRARSSERPRRERAALDPTAPGPRDEEGATSRRGAGEETRPLEPHEFSPEERERRAAGTAPSAAAATTSERGPDGKVAARAVKGKVVDLATGEPIAGARVELVIWDAEGTVVPSGSWGTSSAADGTFETGPGKAAPERRTLRTGVRAGAQGYLTAFAPADEGIVVRLEARRGPVARGRVLGYATDRGGNPLTGLLYLDVVSRDTGWSGIWALADAGGNFEIAGLPADAYTLRVRSGDPQEVTVGDGADVRVHFVADRAAESGQAKHDVTREVRVTGLPAESGLHARLHLDEASRMYFRASVSDGAVTFPAVPLQRWRLVLERDDREEVVRTFAVAAGEGAVLVDVAK